MFGQRIRDHLAEIPVCTLISERPILQLKLNSVEVGVSEEIELPGRRYTGCR